jgi:MoaA/NifB/PqqE/SkfB family radical SAM enzyme
MVGKIIDSVLNKSLNFKEITLSNYFLRKTLVKLFEKRIRSSVLKVKDRPFKVQEDKYFMLKSMIRSFEKALVNASRSPKVMEGIFNFIQNVFLKEKPQIKEFRKKFGQDPPAFLTISPTRFCNLKCIGCYADSSSECSEKLDWDVLNRIIVEKKELWGSYFTVISGGEPLLYESKGKTIIDLAKEHQDNYFLMYTNGTLIDEKMAERIAEVGNISPAISVEGFEKETDNRRGKGVFQKILKAMENLRKFSVPFGISITATRKNADLILSDEFIDFYFNKLGAIYGWIFQLMPIGRGSFDLLITPEQRLKMFRRTQEIIRKKRIFIADFWNCGSVSDGCISAGRSGGYFYIEWSGNVTPCVFNPYAVANINEIYKRGGTLNDVLNTPFFKKIREWQNEYGFLKKPEETGDWILPCPIRDHYQQMKEFIKECNAFPIDEAAKNAFSDEEYEKKMVEYDEELAKIFDPIWKKEYLGKD